MRDILVMLYAQVIDLQGISDKHGHVHNFRSPGSSELVAMCSASMIVIGDCDRSGSDGLHDIVVADDEGGKRGLAPQKPMRIDWNLYKVFGSTTFVTVLESDWNIDNCVQRHVQRKFLRSHIACMLSILEQESVLFNEGLLRDPHKQCLQIPVYFFDSATNLPLATFVGCSYQRPTCQV